MTHDKDDTAAEAREGLLDNIAGKAKEVVGAVTGRDDLAEEGQLQQAEAAHRKDAVAEKAVADAKRDGAAQELRESNQEAAAHQEVANDQADAAQRAVDRERQEQHVAAEREAAQQEAVGRQAAEQRAEDVAETAVGDAEALAADAATTERQAAEDRARLEREADAAARQAAQLRDQDPSQG